MNDEILERIALVTIILGLILGYILVLDFEPKDAHYLTTEDNNAYLEGTITKKRYNNESGWSMMEIKTCKSTKSFYKGEIKKGEQDKIYIKGTYNGETFIIDNYK